MVDTLDCEFQDFNLDLIIDRELNDGDGQERHSRILENFGLISESSLVISGSRMYGVSRWDSDYDFICFASVADKELYGRVSAKIGRGRLKSTSYKQGFAIFNEPEEMFMYSYLSDDCRIKVYIYTDKEKSERRVTFDSEMKKTVKSRKITEKLCRQFLCHYEICVGEKEGESDLKKVHILLLLAELKKMEKTSTEWAMLECIKKFIRKGHLNRDGFFNFENDKDYCTIQTDNAGVRDSHKVSKDNMLMFQEGLETENIRECNFDIIRNVIERVDNFHFEKARCNCLMREKVSNYKLLGHSFYDISIPESIGLGEACLMIFEGEIVSHGIGKTKDLSHYSAVENKSKCTKEIEFTLSFNTIPTASYLRKMLFTNLTLFDCQCLILLFGRLRMDLENRELTKPTGFFDEVLSHHYTKTLYDAFRGLDERVDSEHWEPVD